MSYLLLLLSGALLANGIPHLVNGISGRQFAEPFVYRFLRFIPNPMFNTLWGLLSLTLGVTALYAGSSEGFALGVNGETGAWGLGFGGTSMVLSRFFAKGGWSKD